MSPRLHLTLVVAIVAVLVRPGAAARLDILRSVGGLAPHVVGLFEEPVGFQQSAKGTYYVFDRRGHAVYTVAPDRTSAKRVLDIGQEEGRILLPSGFDVAPDGSFVVADVPRGRERIQVFGPDLERIGGFTLAGRVAPDLIAGNVAMSGISSLQYTGTTLLLNLPVVGGLVTEYSTHGTPQRTIGLLRPTGHERDTDLHQALNAGLPLVDPTGGFFYVFLAGEPKFRKYDASGRLLFERHIEGREIEAFVASQPTVWPTRRVDDREVPFVQPLVRAAAVDAQGQLWISMNVPYTYVYDHDGDKVRTVQFSATGIISPTSLFFTRTGHILVTPGCFEFDPGQS